MKNKIITIGLSPCWDKTIEIAGIDWNQHKIISSSKIIPAGKALNINRALAWMGTDSTAAGLWGSDDFSRMKETLLCHSRESGSPRVNLCFTKVHGQTRENITVVDTTNKRQMHFRNKSTLANSQSLKILKRDLSKIIVKNSFCVFAGATPNNAVALIEFAKKKGASVIVDTSGPALKKIVAKGGLFLIKPNIEELSELVGRKIKNEEVAIISAAKKLLKKVKYILVSRGDKGAMLMFNCRRTGDASTVAIFAKYTGKKIDVCNTVACGDYLLAGFLNCFNSSPDNLKLALETAVKSATAKAFGLNEKLTWSQVQNRIEVKF